MTEYTIIRSSRKTLAIQVKSDGSVIVRSPMKTQKEFIETFVAAHEDWIVRHVEEVRSAARPEPDAATEKKLRAMADDLIPERVAYYSKIMKVTPTRITITGAKTRFGSCSGKNSISFSWRLMQYPPEAIDYVVVHELAHIKHHDHSKRFYDFVASVLPDHKQRRALLKKAPIQA